MCPRTPIPPLYRGREAAPTAHEIPWSRLAANGLHEIKPAAYRDAPSALAFALAFIGDRLTRRESASPLLWCLTERAAREWGAPYGPGLIAFGLDPALVLIVQARNATDAAWALEEGLKAGAFIAVLGQIEVKAPIIARRLGLAAQVSRTPCLLLSGHQGGGLPGTLTRWRVAAERTSGAAFDASAPGPPAWHLTLERCRGMAPARSWTVEFRDVAYGFRLAPRFADRAAEAERNGKPFPVDRPFALVGSEDRGLLLTALNAAAMREGLSPGMGLADARAICPQLLTAPAAPDKDAACLLALARWSGRYSPSLNVDGDDGLWLDVSGVPHLFGGARALLADMARRFARLGFSARIALAETLGGAHALARYAHSSSIIVPQGKIGGSARAPSRRGFAP